MKGIQIVVTSLSVLFLVSACAVKNNTTTVNKEQYSVEVITVEDKALEAIKATPTEFHVAYGQEAYAWERAMLFFSSYLDNEKYSKTELPKGGLRLSNRLGGKSKFIYEVEKYAARNGFLYFVKCKPKGKQSNYSLAIQNAQNLSRFIQEGKLEVSLLVR